MIHGTGAPKFYIYDSTRSTLQTIPSNLGSNGCITLSKRVVLTEHEPQWVGIEHPDMPYTHESMEEFLGYRYGATITCRQEDYTGGLLQYVANQANTNVTDIYKMKEIQAYADAGYEIKFTPHADAEDVWNSPFPIWARPKIISMTRGGRIYSDIFVMQITGTQLIESPFAFEAFSFETLNGVLNANQCLSLNGTSQYATCSSFSIGTTHTITFWAKLAIDLAFETVLDLGSGGIFFVNSNQTLRYDLSGGDFVAKATGTLSSSDRHFFVITRSGTTITIYMDGVSLGSGTLSSNTSMSVTAAFWDGSANYLSSKISNIGIYTDVKTQEEITRLYNSGYGNWPIETNLAAFWGFDGTGGTSTTETDQSGNSRTLTLVGTPTRTTW